VCCHILSVYSRSAAHNLQKLGQSLAVVPRACDPGEDVVRQAMADAGLVPSRPFLSLVPVLERPTIWWQFAPLRATSSTPLQRVLFIPPPGRAASHSTPRG
jgi:hypothetical protein